MTAQINKAEVIAKAKAVAGELQMAFIQTIPGTTIYNIAQQNKECVTLAPSGNAIYILSKGVTPGDVIRASECAFRAYQSEAISGPTVIKVRPRLAETKFGCRSLNEAFTIQRETRIAGVPTISFIPK